MKITKELIELHRENGYYIYVRQLESGNGYFVEFPRNFEKKSFIIAYIIDKEKIRVTLEKEDGSGLNSEWISSKEFSIPIIILDLLILMEKLNINNKLCDFNFNKRELDDDAKYVFALKNVIKMSDSITVSQELKDACEKLLTNGGICNA